jgi:predicted DNA-binding transcriptional regulator YafY
MRADRLISLVMLLQSRGKMTAPALAEALEVSERTIYRDIDALSAAGVPVYGMPGRNGGFALVDRYRTSLTGLTSDEIRALFMLSIPAPLEALGVSDALQQALRKLAASLPAGHREAEQHVRQRFHLDATWWQQGRGAVPHLQTLHRAVQEDRVLTIRYEAFPGLEIEQHAAAYGLVAKAGVWYGVLRRIEAAARDTGTGVGPVRVHRIDRLIDARLEPSTFARPADFDLAAFWARWCEVRESGYHGYRVRVRAAPDVLRWLAPHDPRPMDADPGATDAEGWTHLTLSFESLDDARRQLLGFGGAVEVLSPPALRWSMADHARQIVACYEE